MADKKLRIGTPVVWVDTCGLFETKGKVYHAVVLRHGRDSVGTYTLIELDDDESSTLKVHRSELRTMEESGLRVGLQVPD